MMYGFEMRNGQVVQVEAETLAEGIQLAEEQEHSQVSRGRSIGEYDDNGGRSDVAQLAFLADRRQQYEDEQRALLSDGGTA